MAEQGPRALSISAFAREMGISDRLAYELARTGQLPGAIRLGRRWIVPTRVVDEMLGERRTPANGE